MDRVLVRIPKDAKAVLGDYVGRHTGELVQQVHPGSPVATQLQPLTQPIHIALYDGGEFLDILFGKEGAYRLASHVMMVVGDGAEGHGIHVAEHAHGPSPFLDRLCLERVEYGEELMVSDMQLIWVDADDGAVGVVELSNLVGVSASFDYVVVEFVPGVTFRPQQRPACVCAWTYQNVTAASFGPGKLAIGLR